MLIPRISKVTVKGGAIEFGNEINNLENDLTKSQELLQNYRKLPKNKGVIKGLRDLAIKSPRSAIFEAWSLIEYHLGQYAYESKSITKKENIYENVLYHEVAKTLFKENDRIYSFYNDLRMLRNKVVHDYNFEPTTENAQAFISLALSLTSAIDIRKKDLVTG